MQLGFFWARAVHSLLLWDDANMSSSCQLRAQSERVSFQNAPRVSRPHWPFLHAHPSCLSHSCTPNARTLLLEPRGGAGDQQGGDQRGFLFWLIGSLSGTGAAEDDRSRAQLVVETTKVGGDAARGGNDEGRWRRSSWWKRRR